MTGTSQKIAYTVRATLPDRASADRYLAWLLDGHLRAVLQGGALSGSAVELDQGSGTIVIEARYLFGSQAEFNQYVSETAPKLRAEGLALFGVGTGISFNRSVGLHHEVAV